MGLIGRFSNLIYFAMPAICAVLTWLAACLIYRDPWAKLSRPMFFRSAVAAVALFIPAGLAYHPTGPFLLTAVITAYIGFSSRRRSVIVVSLVVVAFSVGHGSQLFQRFFTSADDEGNLDLSQIVALERTSSTVVGALLLVSGALLMWLERRAERSG